MLSFFYLFVIVACAKLASAQTGAYTTCPTYAIITTRGCCDPRLTSYIAPLSRVLALQLEDGGVHYETDYDADYAKTSALASTLATGPALAYVTAGSLALTNYTASLAMRCPKTPIAMLAYSEGTFVQLLAQNNPAFPLDHITVNALWGNMFWAAGRPENAGTAKTGRSTFGLLGLDPLTTPKVLVPKTQDYCLYGDNICTGTDVNDAHHHYIIDPWLKTTIDYLVQGLRAAGVKPALR